MHWFRRPADARLDGFLSRPDFEKQVVLARACSDRTQLPFRILSFTVNCGGPASLREQLVAVLARVIHNRTRLNDIKGATGEDGAGLGIILYNTNTEEAFILAKAIETLFASRVKSEFPALERPPSLVCDVYSYPQPPGREDGGEPGAAGAAGEAPRKPRGAEVHRSVFAFTARPVPFWKRGADIVLASAALLVLSPLFAAVALYIKAVSKGPVFFRQIRVGRGNKPFVLWKFRSMHTGTDTEQHRLYIAKLIGECNRGGNNNVPMTKTEDHDPQVIPFGNILRKACIDELPQLFNVVLGDMSLVGPRPPIPYEVNEYLSWHIGRLDTVPGMTGLWQVSGKNKLSFNEMVRLDIQYAQNVSPWMDLKIILLTPVAIGAQIKESFFSKTIPQSRVMENA